MVVVTDPSVAAKILRSDAIDKFTFIMKPFEDVSSEFKHILEINVANEASLIQYAHILQKAVSPHHKLGVLAVCFCQHQVELCYASTKESKTSPS